jgi:NB-ARC domain/Tetratricopeptide repeat
LPEQPNGGAAGQFAKALRELYDAAGHPTLESLARRAAAQRPPLKLSPSSVHDWLNGVSVPSNPALIVFLVGHLQGLAKRRKAGFSIRPVEGWLRLREAAEEERRAGRGRGGRPARAAEGQAERARSRFGLIPRLADCFQERDVVDLRDRTVGCYVLSGLGGVGKTQLAARLARALWDRGEVELSVWITAASRPAVLAALAQAGIEQTDADPDDPERAAARFLTYLETTDKRWLVVLDDITDPDDLRGLWPPDRPGGWVLATTRRRDAALAGERRQIIKVGLFGPAEAAAYLTAKLAGGRDDSADQIAGLAADLGHLPLALAQAAAFLIDTAIGIRDYRRLFADRQQTLADLTPDRLPDDQTATIAATWSLSVDHADRLRPAGLARPMLQLAAMLDPNGIPGNVLASPAALRYLADHRSRDSDRRPPRWWPRRKSEAQLSRGEAEAALSCLHRLSLADHAPQVRHRTVRVHQLVQRATRESLIADRLDRLARTAGDALLETWPEIENDAELAQSYRANTAALYAVASNALLEPQGHDVLIRMGNSLGTAGMLTPAVTHFQGLYAASLRRVGPDGTDTLIVRQALAHWRGTAGDAIGAAVAHEELLADQRRILGPADPTVLYTRRQLAHWQAETGDYAGAVVAYGRLLSDQRRVLGPDDTEVLLTRGELARRRGDAGDLAGAVADYDSLLPDLLRVLGADHPDVLFVRHEIARLQGELGTVTGEVTALRDLLQQQLATLGPDHPEVLNLRLQLARWQAETATPAETVAALEGVLTDQIRVLGSEHPDVLSARCDLATARGEAGDPSGALMALEQLVSDALRLLGPSSLSTLVARHVLARWRGETGDHEGAIADCEDLLRDQELLLGPDHVETLLTRGSLAHWRMRKGDVDDAVEAYEELLRDRIRVLGPDHPLTLANRHELALAWSRTREFTLAVAALEDILKDKTRLNGAEHPGTLVICHDLACVRGDAGDPSSAVADLRDLLLTCQRVLGSDHPLTLTVRRSLASWQGEVGDPAIAAESLQALLEDQLRVLGPDHPDTFVTRDELARWQDLAG